MFRHALRALPAAVALPVVAIALAAVAAAAPATPQQLPSALVSTELGLGPQLAAVRAATERYRDVRVALADGYVSEKACIAMPGTGAMGVHFVHPKRMGLVMTDGRIDGTDT